MLERDTEPRIHPGIVQDGVTRSSRRERIGVRRHRAKARRGPRNARPTFVDNGAGKSVPRRGPGGGQVVQALPRTRYREILTGCKAGEYLTGGCGDRSRPGRRTDLVADDLQLLSGRDSTEDCQQEVFPGQTVQPSRPQDDVLAARTCDSALARELRRAVLVQRRRFLVFEIRRSLTSIEDVVGRKVNERDVEPVRFLRERPRGVGVHGIRHSDLCLRGIDGGVRCRVDEHTWLHRANHMPDAGRMREVEVRPRGGGDVTQCGENSM